MSFIAARNVQGRLGSASFLGLLATQLLGALNDNMFRLLAVGIGTEHVGAERSSVVLSLGLGCFTLPYLVLAGPAGYLADRFSKRDVIVGCKLAEIVVMALAVLAIYLESLFGLFFVLALMGAHSALYGPAKLGSIPEMLRADKISFANGLIGLSTVVATVLGVVAGSYLHDATRPKGLSQLWMTGAALLGVASLGTLTSLLIARLPAGNRALRFPWSPRQIAGQTLGDLAALAASRAMLRVALGTAFFWSLGALAQSNILEYGKEGGLLQKDTSPLLTSLVLGVGLGSVLAGIASGGKVELGILPLGAGGVALSSAMLFTINPDLRGGLGSAAYLSSCWWLFGLGLSAGLFDVPLSAYLQHRSPPESRGAILAASNFITFSGILLSAGLYYLLRVPRADGRPLLDAHQIFLLAGVFTIPVFLYIVLLLPGASIRFLVWLASHSVYRVRVFGRENLPERGGALLVCNHVTPIDGVLLLIASSRPIRLLVHSDYLRSGIMRRLGRIMGAIAITPGNKSVAESLEAAREALRQGEFVCIFPEGEPTRTGELQAFRPGLAAITAGTSEPVLPVYLDELWGSIFSFRGGKSRWKWPRRWPFPVSIHIGLPVHERQDVQRIRQAVVELGEQAVQDRQSREEGRQNEKQRPEQPGAKAGGHLQSQDMILPRRFLRMCRRNLRSPKIADSFGTELSGAKLLLAALAMRRALVHKLLEPDETYVGVLMPPSVGGVLVNIALPLAKRIAVNLNYTVSADVMNSCIRQCGIRRVLTSRKIIERLNLKIDAELVYLEDFRTQISKADKAIAAVQAFATPMPLLERLLGLHTISPDDTLTVIFTSGSTGEPKGVMLSHRNVGSNIEAIGRAISLKSSDALIGVLPFFHSYGYTATLWTALAFDSKGAYHVDPRDAGQVGKLCHKHKATILMGTPTFLRYYLRRCEPQELASLEVVFASAEKLPKDLADAFEQKFGVRPLEAYGATELAPLVSVNVPPTRARSDQGPTAREGSVGRPIPGVQAKVVDPETGEALPVDMPGMLLICGPNIMKGYLHHPDLTAKVIRDGWYVTGDMARIDADGFIFITGRESRFSKIGGEMVPHIKIEETLQRVLGAGEEQLLAVVSAVPDAKKGERLLVFHTALTQSPQQICQALQQAGLPNLWIPSHDSFCQIEEIPVLGTGKLDLKALKSLAMERFGEAVSAGR